MPEVSWIAAVELMQAVVLLFVYRDGVFPIWALAPIYTGVLLLDIIVFHLIHEYLADTENEESK